MKMHHLRLALLLSLSASLGACASLLTPNSTEIARLPVVDFGQTPPSGEFVLRYPAGIDLPVVAQIDGTLLERRDQATLKVRVKRDVYVYRDLASFDGKSWQPGHQVIGGRLTMALPGDRNGKRDAVSPGEIAAEFNLKH